MAQPAAHDAAHRMTLQEVVAGHPVTDVVGAAPEAGALLAALHSAPAPTSGRILDPMVGAVATARTVTALRPDLAPRLDALVDRLRATAPAPSGSRAGAAGSAGSAGSAPVLCHGDFHPRQLLRDDDGLIVLDLDEWGVGAAGLDLGTYAAHALDRVDGADRAATLDAVVDGLTAGYGRRPDDLDWHVAVAVLRRAVFPFRTHPTPDWPDQVEAMVATAEEAVAR